MKTCNSSIYKLSYILQLYTKVNLVKGMLLKGLILLSFLKSQPSFYNGGRICNLLLLCFGLLFFSFLLMNVIN
jgi:hypothetical protein